MPTYDEDNQPCVLGAGTVYCVTHGQPHDTCLSEMANAVEDKQCITCGDTAEHRHCPWCGRYLRISQPCPIGC